MCHSTDTHVCERTHTPPKLPQTTLSPTAGSANLVLILPYFIFKGAGCDLINEFHDLHVGCNPQLEEHCLILPAPHLQPFFLPRLPFPHLAPLQDLCICCSLCLVCFSLHPLMTTFLIVSGFCSNAHQRFLPATTLRCGALHPSSPALLFSPAVLTT